MSADTRRIRVAQISAMLARTGGDVERLVRDAYAEGRRDGLEEARRERDLTVDRDVADEVWHAAQHVGTVVPSLASCPEHQAGPPRASHTDHVRRDDVAERRPPVV